MVPKTKTFKFRGIRYDARWKNAANPLGFMMLNERQLCPEIRMDKVGMLSAQDKHILDVELITIVLKQPFINEARTEHTNKGGWSLCQLFDTIEDDFRYQLHRSKDNAIYRMNPNYAITDLFYLIKAKITYSIFNNIVCTIESVQ